MPLDLSEVHRLLGTVMAGSSSVTGSPPSDTTLTGIPSLNCWSETWHPLRKQSASRYVLTSALVCINKTVSSSPTLHFSRRSGGMLFRIKEAPGGTHTAVTLGHSNAVATKFLMRHQRFWSRVGVSSILGRTSAGDANPIEWVGNL